MSTVKPTLQLLSGTADTPDPAPAVAFRVRPGERAVWIEANAPGRELREWRDEAASLGLSVDVLLALKLEWWLVRRDIADPLRRAALLELAHTEATSSRLAPSDELRRWVAYLSRGGQPHAEHDLPSIALPARVIARIAPSTLVQEVRDRANDILDQNAVGVECAASRNGMTMESWAYRALAIVG